VKETIRVGLLGLGILFGVAIPIQSKIFDNNHPLEVSQISQAIDDDAQVLEIQQTVAPQYTVVRRYQAVTSWYRHGHTTANGERYNPYGLSTAHKTLPFNTMVRLTNPLNGRSVIVRVNDRGPFIKGREFDVSLGAARELDMVDIGVTRLIVEILQQ
jgi:rare lipoprotein A